MTRPPQTPGISRRQCLRLALLRLPLWGAVPVAGLLAGCSLGSGQRRDFHLLQDAGAPAGGQAQKSSGLSTPRIDKVLLLGSGAMPGLYDSDRMVFSADGLSRSYFQFGTWSERPAQALLVLAETRFASAQRFREVALSTSGVRGDLLLTLRLDELYLDASAESGQVKLIVSAELVDWQNRKLLARRNFSQSRAVERRDAGGVALAASHAVGVVMGELVDWAASSAATAPTA